MNNDVKISSDITEKKILAAQTILLELGGSELI
jgi:hypothetical protein